MMHAGRLTDRRGGCLLEGRPPDTPEVGILVGFCGRIGNCAG